MRKGDDRREGSAEGSRGRREWRIGKERGRGLGKESERSSACLHHNQRLSRSSNGERARRPGRLKLSPATQPVPILLSPFLFPNSTKRRYHGLPTNRKLRMYNCHPSIVLRHRHRRFRRAEHLGPGRPGSELTTDGPSCAARVPANKHLHTVARQRQCQIQPCRRRRLVALRQICQIALRRRRPLVRPFERGHLPRLRPDCMGRRRCRRLARAGDARPAVRVHPDSDHHIAAVYPG